MPVAVKEIDGSVSAERPSLTEPMPFGFRWVLPSKGTVQVAAAEV